MFSFYFWNNLKYKSPIDLPDELRDSFAKQERERYSLRLRHKIEQVFWLIIIILHVLRANFYKNRAFEDIGKKIIPNLVLIICL
jgi:hypothetical protein